MKSINPEWIRQIQSADNPYFDLQQMSIQDLGWGTARLEISLARRHLQPFGVVHGGVCASLLDAAGFWAVFTRVDPKAGMTTIELKINYLSPIVNGRLIGLGSCIKLGRSLGLGEARIEDENGRLLAHGTTTVMVKPDMPLPESIQAVPKYLD
ncbi:MAG: PaaI family thioesterase [Thermodesulfobacteriota bacterium]